MGLVDVVDRVYTTRIPEVYEYLVEVCFGFRRPVHDYGKFQDIRGISAVVVGAISTAGTDYD